MAPQPTCFLVMDENDCTQTDVFAFVGVIVPIEDADAIRLGLYQFIRSLANLPEEALLMAPPELHGSDMLRPSETYPWADEHRFRCYEHVVQAVNHHRLRVVRQAYFGASLVVSEQPDGKKNTVAKLQLGYESLLRTKPVQQALAASYVIPVMDGLAKEQFSDKLSPRARFVNIVRSAPGFQGDPLQPQNMHNLMEPLYVDSAQSALMQVTDVTGYLLQILDWDRQAATCEQCAKELQRGDFKPKLVSIAKTLDSTLVYEPEPVNLCIGGKTATRSDCPKHERHSRRQ